MRRGWKIFWIFIAIITALGIICGCIAIALGVTVADLGNDFAVIEESMIVKEEVLTTGETTVISNDSAEIYEFDNITDMDVRVGACKVGICVGKSDVVQVDVSRMKYGSVGLELSVREENGTLILETTENGSLKDVLSLGKNKNGGVLKIYLPEGMILNNANFEFGACDAEVSGVTAGHVNITMGAADCEMEQMSTNKLSVEVGAGDFDYSGSVLESVNVDCGAGDVELKLTGTREEFNYDLNAGLGEIEIGDKEYGGLAVDEKINNHAEKTMVIDCGAGSVSVDFR